MPDPKEYTLRDIEEIAEKCAAKAIRSVFVTLGVDIDKPLEAQKDFHDLRQMARKLSDPEIEKDLDHMRVWRTRTEQVSSKGALVVITAVVGGALTVFWTGVQHLFAIGGK